MCIRDSPYIPIVGIEPALKPAALCMEHPKVLVMATPMTIHEEKFHVLKERYKEKAQILPLPCPGLMDFIERGDLDGEDLHRSAYYLLLPNEPAQDPAFYENPKNLLHPEQNSS